MRARRPDLPPLRQLPVENVENCFNEGKFYQNKFKFSPNGLKGPKREIFGLRIFAQIRPIWIGYLGTRPKNPKKLRLGPYIALFFPRFLC
jgi:hypothetical protein